MSVSGSVDVPKAVTAQRFESSPIVVWHPCKEVAEEPGNDLEKRAKDPCAEGANERVEEINKKRPGDESDRLAHGECQGATRRPWH